MSSHIRQQMIRGHGLKNYALISVRSITFKVSQFLEHFSVRKFLNLVLAKTQKWIKVDRIHSMPFLFVIDPTNACNLRCKVCPTGLGTLKRPTGLINIQTYKKIIDDIWPYAFDVWLFNWGEPFLHPDIFEIIRYTSSKRIAVRISSNLNRFNEEMAQKTVESGLDKLIVSVDGSNQEVYEHYRQKGNLETVLKNVELLVNAKKKAKSNKPYIYLRMLMNKHNEGQIEEMCRIADALGVDAFRVGPMYIDTTDPEQVKEWLPEDAALSVYDYNADQMTNVYHCADLWESMTINWDGGVAPCCWLHDKKNDFANVNQTSVKDIWNGEAYISSRKVFAFGGAKKGSVSTICTTCKGRPMYLKD